MYLTFNEDDLSRMSDELRQQLMDFVLERSSAADKPSVSEGFVPSGYEGVDLRDLEGWDGFEIDLTVQQAFLLWRHVLGNDIREFQQLQPSEHWQWLLTRSPVAAKVLANLAHESDLTPERLAHLCELEEPKRLGPQIGSINKAIRRMTRNENERLTNVSRSTGLYEVKGTSRDALRIAAENLLNDKK